MAVGAPAQLVQLSQQASLDEMRHTQACFAVASAYLGHSVGPGPLSCSQLRATDRLEELVLSTFVEGCIGETVASMVASAQASATNLPSLRALLLGVSCDEEQHALLAWRFVAWGLQQRPALAPRLRAILAEARRTWSDKTGAASDDHSWHQAGRLTLRERNELVAMAFERVLAPALQRLLDDATLPAPDPLHSAHA